MRWLVDLLEMIKWTIVTELASLEMIYKFIATDVIKLKKWFQFH